MARVAATPRKVILLTVIATMLIPSLVVAGTIARFKLAEPVRGGRPVSYLAAAELQAMGLRKGDRVAIVGEGFEAYYAQIAGLKIVAQFTSEEEFQRLDPSALESVTAHLRVLGVKALITKERPLHASTADWREVAGSAGYSVLQISGKP
jgi:hypothetical protein